MSVNALPSVPSLGDLSAKVGLEFCLHIFTEAAIVVGSGKKVGDRGEMCKQYSRPTFAQRSPTTGGRGMCRDRDDAEAAKKKTLSPPSFSGKSYIAYDSRR